MTNFIEVYDNSMSDELIEKFQTYFHANPQYHYKGTVSHSDGEGNVTQSTNAYDTKVSTDMSSYDWPPSLSDSYITEVLGPCLSKYHEKYEWSNNVNQYAIKELMNYQWYKLGEGFKAWHMEQTGNEVGGARHLVFMTYLNTVEDPDNTFEGGTEFLYQDMKLKAVKGRTVIWPAPWTHTHRGIVSETQEKEILTGWWTFING